MKKLLNLILLLTILLSNYAYSKDFKLDSLVNEIDNNTRVLNGKKAKTFLNHFIGIYSSNGLFDKESVYFYNKYNDTSLLACIKFGINSVYISEKIKDKNTYTVHFIINKKILLIAKYNIKSNKPISYEFMFESVHLLMKHVGKDKNDNKR